jgi:hypothetical protein
VELRFPHRSLREFPSGRALASRSRRGGVEGTALQTSLAESAGDPGGRSPLFVRAVAALSRHTRQEDLVGAAEALVMPAPQHLHEGKASLAMLAVARAMSSCLCSATRSLS